MKHGTLKVCNLPMIVRGPLRHYRTLGLRGVPAKEQLGY